MCIRDSLLSVQENVDPERIGIIGICGWGGMAINAAAIDTRIKATAAMTMYDMTRVTANGYFDAEDSEQTRYEKKKAMNAQRTADYKNGTYALAGGVVDPLPEDAPQFVKDYYAYYKSTVLAEVLFCEFHVLYQFQRSQILLLLIPDGIISH